VFQYLGVEFVRNGGEFAFGGAGITAIEDVASRPLADASAAAGTSGAAQQGQSADVPPQANQQPFKLGSNKAPKVQRTGGKKSLFSSKCCIL